MLVCWNALEWDILNILVLIKTVHDYQERLQTMTDPGFEANVRAKLEEVRGMLKADGGDLEVVAIEGKKVKLKLRGACGGCPHASITIKQGIERHLRENLDSAIEVIRVT